MNFRIHLNLIPRNNWDYGFTALLRALTGIRPHSSQASNAENIFQHTPLWTTSGRASLYAILKSLDLPAEAKVGVPLFCCSVVFNAIVQAGLSPCFLDVGMDYNLSVEDLREKRADLAAVVAVHMFGNPCDMDAIITVTDNIPVIEDCAQSIFSAYKGGQTGSLSTASFFSFRCGKYISAGEGSAILCRDEELYRRVEQVVASFETWSSSKMIVNALSTFVKAALYNRPWYGLIGHPIGMRLDKKLNLTAKDGFETRQIAPSHLALIEARLADFEKRIDVQRKHARLLQSLLTPGILSLPINASGNAFQFALCFESSAQRDAMSTYLFEYGIDTAKYLDTIADEARADYGYKGDCPNAEQLAKTTLLIPIHYTLSTRDIEHAANVINAFFCKI